MDLRERRLVTRFCGLPSVIEFHRFMPTGQAPSQEFVDPGPLVYASPTVCYLHTDDSSFSLISFRFRAISIRVWPVIILFEQGCRGGNGTVAGQRHPVHEKPSGYLGSVLTDRLEYCIDYCITTSVVYEHDFRVSS